MWCVDVPEKQSASEVTAGVDAKLATVVLVVSNTSIRRRRVLAIALQIAIDCSNGGSKTLAGSYERVAGVHPKP